MDYSAKLDEWVVGRAPNASEADVTDMQWKVFLNVIQKVNNKKRKNLKKFKHEPIGIPSPESITLNRIRLFHSTRRVLV